MTRIGMIAGWGKLPRLWAKKASKTGNKIYVFSLQEENTAGLDTYAEKIIPVHIGKLGHLIDLLHEHGIKQLALIGRVKKTQLYRMEPDLRMRQLLVGLEDHGDDRILRALAAEFSKEGIEIITQTKFLGQLLVEPGLLTSQKPNFTLQKEMEYAFQMALQVGRLDIGQTVLTKDKAVLAVEAAEGTDLTIKRAGQLGGKDVVMAKAFKPEQDYRFDIPTLGLNTIVNLLDIKARGLVFEAKKTFLLDQKEFINRAEKAGITVVAVDAAEFCQKGGIRWGK